MVRVRGVGGDKSLERERERDVGSEKRSQSNTQSRGTWAKPSGALGGGSIQSWQMPQGTATSVCGALPLCLAALHAELHVVKGLGSDGLSWNPAWGTGDSRCLAPFCPAVSSPVNNDPLAPTS